MDAIDAHVHVWTNRFERFPINPTYRPAEMIPPTFLPTELFAHTRPAGVTRIVLVQMSYYGCDNSYMLHVMQQYPNTFAGIAIVDWEADRPDVQMQHLAERGVRGFRVYPKHSPAGRWLDAEGFERMFRMGAQADLAICVLIDPDGLADLDRCCGQFPETPVIIDHLCRIGVSQPIQEPHIDQLCSMAKHPRVMVKVSAFYALGRKHPPYADLRELVRRVYEAFGPERLMWGSDCPYQVMEHRYADSIRFVHDGLDFLSEMDRQQILRTTAEAFFFRNRSERRPQWQLSW